MSQVLAFFGNRHAPLSRAFFRGLSRARAAAPARFDLVLVDTATARQTGLRSRLRHVAVSAIKSVLRAGVQTSTLDWFRDPQARALPQITAPHHDLKDPRFAADLRARGVAAVLVAGCDQILREPLVSSVPRIVNFHNGLLPEYRGVQAVAWAFLNRESVAGYTFHTVEGASIDRGRPVLRRELAILPGQTPLEFDEFLVQDAVQHLDVVLDALLSDTEWPPPTPPMQGGAYYSAKRSRRVRRFDPSLPVEETVHRLTILGSLDLGTGRVPLKITAGNSVPPEATGGLDHRRWKRSGRSVIVRCVDGGFEIRAIDYVPAVALSWLLPAVIEPPPPA